MSELFADGRAPQRQHNRRFVLQITKAAFLTFALCALSTAAEAQMTWTDRGFVNANFGGQAGSRTLSTSTEFEIYGSQEFGERATLSTSQDVGGGAFFDISGGYKVWRNLVVGIGFTRVAGDSDVSVNASVPDPLISDRPRSVSTTATGSEHSEVAINLSGTWMMPVTDKVDVGFSFGPTIFSVSQDVPTSITVSEPGPTITSTNFNRIDKSTVGVHFGVDTTYLIRPKLGAGAFLRYTVGSVDLEGADDNLTVGGFQIGFGVRYRF